MTEAQTYHGVDNEVDIQQCLEIFWKKFPLSRCLRVHDGFIIYHLPISKYGGNRQWLREANEIIVELDLPLKAKLEEQKTGFNTQSLTIERK